MPVLSLSPSIDAAVAAFEARRGEACALRAEALDDARRATAVLPARLWAVAAPALTDPARYAQEVGGGLEFDIGAQGGRTRAAHAAAAQAELARCSTDKVGFIEALVSLHLDAALARAEASHLAAWHDQLVSDLSPLSEAAARGQLATLDLRDLQSEAAWIAGEVADARERATRLEGLTRAAFSPIAPPSWELEFDALPVADAPPDPEGWLDPRALSAAATASATAASADADCAGYQANLSIGLSMRPGATPTLNALPYAALTLPLTVPGRDRCLARRGDAAAAELDAGWVARAWTAERLAQWESVEAAQTRAAALEEALAPLADRADALKVAFSTRQIPAERLVRGRREHHDAEHATHLAEAEVLRRKIAYLITRQLAEQP